MAEDRNKLVDTYLSVYKRWYWKDPEHARALQRDKYQRYPEKIYAMNIAWQKRNKTHWSALMKFAYQIRKAKLAGDMLLESQLRAAREEYKRMHREQSAKIKELAKLLSFSIVYELLAQHRKKHLRCLILNLMKTTLLCHVLY